MCVCVCERERERERERGRERGREGESVFCSAILHDCLSGLRILVKHQRIHPADRMVFRSALI